MMREVVIVSAVRTPIGTFLGSLAHLPADALGTAVISHILNEIDLDISEISQVILGQVLTGGQGQNPPRKAAINAGIPYTTPAFGVSMVCGSGLKSVILGATSILVGESDIVLAGGQESMSKSHHSLHLRSKFNFGHTDFKDTMLSDGLTDATGGYHMGVTAENLAKKYGISRERQEKFALRSQEKTASAMRSDHFRKEIAPVVISKNKEDAKRFEVDEHPRPKVTMESLQSLRPVFQKDGTVTAGTSSGLADGAACVLLMSIEKAVEKKVPVLAKIVSHATAGVDPSLMGLGPIAAVRSAIAKAGWYIEDVDLFELNEAFAVQSLVCIQELGIDPKKVNVFGGAISLGHPLGASGCRILVTLLNALRVKGLKRGVASLCVGGGMGVALCVEIPS